MKLLRLSGVLPALILVATTLTITAQSTLQADGGHPSVIAFGDSVSLGVGAGNNNSYVDLLEDWSKVRIANKSVRGITTKEAYDSLDTTVFSRESDIVILFLGGNDIIQNVSKEQTINNLRLIIERIQRRRGGEIILLGLHSNVFRLEYETAYRELAKETEILYVPNVLQGIIGNPKFTTDALHPNAVGHHLIAERVFPVFAHALTKAAEKDTPVHVFCTVNTLQDGERLTSSYSAFTNDAVEWKAYVWGGDEQYSYTWSGDELYKATGSTRNFSDTLTHSYTKFGNKKATVEVRSDSITKSVSCQDTVKIIPQPITARCSVLVRGNTIEWSAFAENADNIGFDYRWKSSSRSDEFEAYTRNITHTYGTPGIKTAQVRITPDGETTHPINLTCKGEIIDTPNTTASCAPQSNYLSDVVVWNAHTTISNPEFKWSGTNSLDATTNIASKQYTSSGIKTGRVKITNSDGASTQLECQTKITVEEEESSGCFIATAAFGTDLEPEVLLLREFRDNHLLTHTIGKAVVKTYYTVSPPIAETIRDSESLKALTRAGLTPITKVVGWIN